MKHRSFTVDGHRIAGWHRLGGDDLLVCLHGLGCSSTTFAVLDAAAELTSFSLLALDLLGFGESDKPFGHSYSMESQAQTAAQVIRSSSAPRIHLLAHSMGGAVGVLLAPALGGRLASFINIEGNLIPEDCGIISRRAAELPFQQFEKEMYPEYLASLTALGSPSPATADSFYHSAQSLVAASDTGELLRIFLGLNCPKLYIYGEANRDHPTVAATAAVPQRAISGSGHFPMFENPPEFCRALVEFLGAGR